VIVTGIGLLLLQAVDEELVGLGLLEVVDRANRR